MCDTIVAVPPATANNAVWFGKNSDREPGEAQIVEHLPAQKFSSPAKSQCTYVELPQAAETFEVVLSRPFWMWGAEMGANSHGVAIGNEAVFTKLPVPKTGLTGMDLLRLALERSTTAREALGLIARLITDFGQGGLCGYRHKGFRYHNSFIIADPIEAWVLETADRFWAAERVRGVRTISNVLTIGKEFDLISDGAFEFAKEKGWCKSAADFDFAKAFGDPFFRFTSGGDVRRACTRHRLMLPEGKIGRADLFTALRDHAGHKPESGWRLNMPCAHASWMKTRQSGQTVGSMASRLSADGSLHWLTGTSSPCLSVFKPFVLGSEVISTGAIAGERYDPDSLWWQHERLHRLTLGDYARRRAMTEIERRELEAKILSLGNNVLPTAAECQTTWDEHQAILPKWIDRIAREAKRDRRGWLTRRYWQQQNEADCLPNHL
ncbi:MAG: C69 family dipeptidase [Acidobacteria bacterium]|nr:C69 family dipeptidase [Acidobacteriota bacterium]